MGIRIVMLYVVLFVSDVTAMYSTKQMEGYPLGYLSDCPGSNMEAIILPTTLRHLAISVQTPGNIFTAQHRKYNYYQTKELANDPDLDFSKNTLLFVGGYLHNPDFLSAVIIGTHYRKLGYNVLLLDFFWFTTTHYPIAARFMRPVGKHTAEMLLELTEMGLDPKKLEILGVSLGGQTISFIAKTYKKLTGIKIGKLISLDPAGPCFRHLGPEDRLDKSDADFVQTVHTNIDGLGMATAVGHVNFYVNGGEYQPGEIYWLFCNSFCSHIRAWKLWISALENPYSFIAIQCDSVQQARDRNCYDNTPRVTNILGLYADQYKPGIFYLNTRQRYPYHLGEKGLNHENDFLISRLKIMNARRIMRI